MLGTRKGKPIKQESYYESYRTASGGPLRHPCVCATVWLFGVFMTSLALLFIWTQLWWFFVIGAFAAVAYLFWWTEYLR